MANTSYIMCGTGEQIAGLWNDWVSIENLAAIGWATVTLAASDLSDTARGVNYDFSSIPAGSTIDGVAIRASQASITAAGSVGVYGGRLNMDDDSASAGTYGFSPLALGTTDQDHGAGGSSSLWGETLTLAIIQDVDFGMRFNLENTGIISNDAQVDGAMISVYYTPEVVDATGTVGGSTETQIVAASARTVLLTLTNATWAVIGATFDAQRQGIIDGIDSAQTEALGWNAKVRDTMGVAQCVRTSDTVVTITLLAAEVADYKVTADEVLTATIPASAHSGTSILTDANFATITAECDERLAPTVIDTQTNLTGAVTDIDELVDSPDANWLVAA